MNEGNREQYFEEAVRVAGRSMCRRGRGGSVVVLGGEIIGRGYNAPPNDDEENRMCHTDYRTSSKPKSDRTCCVHAEWRAIFDALKNKGDISGSSIYYTNIDENGEMLKSGKPYCTVCSRLALDNGIKTHNTKEYNKLSYDFHKGK